MPVVDGCDRDAGVRDRLEETATRPLERRELLRAEQPGTAVDPYHERNRGGSFGGHIQVELEVAVAVEHRVRQARMDVGTGESEIRVLMPARWPAGWNHSEAHNIVIDNGIGRATAIFHTEN